METTGDDDADVHNIKPRSTWRGGIINLRELWKFSQERLGILANSFSWTSTFPLLPLPPSLFWKCCSECRLCLNARWKLRIYFKMHSKFQGILEKGKLPWSLASGYICDWRSRADVSMIKMLLRILEKATCFPSFWKWIMTIPAYGAETVSIFITEMHYLSRKVK